MFKVRAYTSITLLMDSIAVNLPFVMPQFARVNMRIVSDDGDAVFLPVSLKIPAFGLHLLLMADDLICCHSFLWG
jgi:hypothetical protein